MSVLTAPTVLAASSGPSPRWALLAFPKVTAADTFDATTLTTIPPFQVVTSALFVALSNRTATTALATGTPGTTVTVAGTGVANDAGILLLVGE